jgi:hypothetical protein
MTDGSSSTPGCVTAAGVTAGLTGWTGPTGVVTG